MGQYKSQYTGPQIDAGIDAALNPDVTVTPDSDALVTSGAVADALDNIDPTITSNTDTTLNGILVGDGGKVGAKSLDTSSLTNDADHVPVSSVVKSALTSLESNLASIQATGNTNATGSAITNGTYFYLNGILVQAKADIASGATFTNGTNYTVVTAGALNELKSAFDYDSGWTSIPMLPSIDLGDALYRIKGKICFLYIKNVGGYTYPADTWINILELPSKITPSIGLNGSCTSRNGNVGEYGVNTDRTVSIRMNTSGNYFSILCSYPID